MIRYALSSVDRVEILCAKHMDGKGGEREKEGEALCLWRFCY